LPLKGLDLVAIPGVEGADGICGAGWGTRFLESDDVVVGEKGLDVATPLVDTAPVGAGTLHVVRHGAEVVELVRHRGGRGGDEAEADDQRDQETKGYGTQAAAAQRCAHRRADRPLDCWCGGGQWLVHVVAPGLMSQ